MKGMARRVRERVTCAYLDLSMCLITDKGAAAVADFLATSETLTELRLQSNHIGEIGACAIATALQSNESLTSLRLESNRLGMGFPQPRSYQCYPSALCPPNFAPSSWDGVFAAAKLPAL